MSRSIHITSKNFRGLTNREIDEQYVDPTSELSQWADKLNIKKTRVKTRKENKILKKEIEKETLGLTEDITLNKDVSNI